MNEQTKPQNINGIHAGVPCVVLPNKVLQKKSLLIGSKILYAVLGSLADDSGACNASNDTLAKQMRASNKEVGKWLCDLHNANLIRFSGRAGLMRTIYLEQDFAKVSAIAQRGGE